MRLLSTLLLCAPVVGQDFDANALFQQHCATCHGVKGDGNGVTPLPKKARSFLDGGFSYGNTSAAIGRTLEFGIPGTPMPSFSEALSADERNAMIEYVIALGPERKEVERAETILEVVDRPHVVRGFLPALGQGVPEWPRGLLVGLTSGTTFQYRADDVRLLAVRQGDFVERRDWGGRGGNSLRPLGKVTHLVGSGNPGAEWTLGDEPLKARLTQTAVRGTQVTISYDLQRNGITVARVRETPGVLRVSTGAGFERSYEIEAVGGAPLDLALRWTPSGANGTTNLYTNVVNGERLYEKVSTFDEGSGHLIDMVILHGDYEVREPKTGGLIRFQLSPGAPRRARVLHAALIEAESFQTFLGEIYR
ncbi:MAG: cytochrome c [Planctomycetota bacterium]|nr:cytochrome c [Planctomycetota bacterium]